MPYSLPGLIERACSPARFDPNLALNLEICEVINKKQGNAARVASQAIVRLVNSNKANQAMLALTLLDNCVKNCGYPLHLQIASKDFLNSLVRRFPDRPPARYAPNPVQSAPENQWNHFDYVPPQQFMANPVIDRILYLIKEWKIALTELSRYKDDMVHIREMYRLLEFKGYRFPELRDSSVAALAPDDTLKSEEELIEEDRMAKSAKLQELIRRGRPQDLVEANKLVKIITGYDQRHQANFKERFREDLHKIQNKARLLYEMLDKMKSGDKMQEDGTMEELKNACDNAIQKIKNMMKDEDDGAKREELNEIRTIVKGVVLKYEDVKNGIFDTEYDLSGKYKNEDTTQESTQQQPISLIDLDDDIPTNNQTPPQSSYNDLNAIFNEDSNTNSDNPFDLLSQSLKTTSLSNQTQHFSPPNTSQSNQTQHVSSSLSQIQLINKNGLVVVLDVLSSGKEWKLKAYYSNISTAPMDNMNLLLAAPKSMQLKMGSVSSTTVPPKSDKSVSQLVSINNPDEKELRLRFKVTYEQFGVEMEQTGEYHQS